MPQFFFLHTRLWSNTRKRYLLNTLTPPKKASTSSLHSSSHTHSLSYNYTHTHTHEVANNYSILKKIWASASRGHHKYLPEWKLPNFKQERNTKQAN